MSQELGESVSRRCPRCGGLMAKPAGSQLYWHADNNHPRCDITNLVDPPLVVQTSAEPPQPQSESPKGTRRKK